MNLTSLRVLCTLLTVLSLGLIACGGEPTAVTEQVFTLAIPPGFPTMPLPADNALSTDRIELGRRLFHDKSLSRTKEVSCGSCHLQEHAFAEPRRVSIGVEGRRGTRNAPALVNLAWTTSYFWDGGVPTLEQQAIAPIINPLEMDMTMGEVVARLSADSSYVRLFRQAYNSEPEPQWVTKAIASFVRTMVSGNSRYDSYNRGDSSALTLSEKRGMAIFNGERAECFHCHAGYNFTNNTFRNNGSLPNDPDIGRALITELDIDRGRFRVPTLRNVALTAPYMHDGRIATLEKVVEHYSDGGEGHPNTDNLIHALNLTAEEQSDIVAFLRSLTDESFIHDPRFAP